MVVATGKPREASLVRVVRLYPDGLRLEEVERPVPREDEVLVRVHAAAITRGELEWPAGRLPAVPSYELSGVVVGTGEEVFALTPSDRDGVAADYARVPLAVLAPKPGRLTHVEAAALPMGGLTAWQALFVHGHLQPGERVLVTGSSGGVGHLAVQLARFAGAEVVEDGPAELVFDTVGGKLPVDGRIVTIAAEAPGARYFVVKPDRDQLVELGRLADAGQLVPAIDSTFPLERAREAFDRVAARGKRGKVVFDVAGG
jgi:NADPH:quinone reductase-like Zn-dependent oxidoreductase